MGRGVFFFIFVSHILFWHTVLSLFAILYNLSTMLSYNEIKPRRYIIFNNEPYEVLDAQVSRKQQRKPVNQAKIRNLITGKVTEQAFHQSEKVEEADIEKRSLVYIYNNKGEWWFHPAGVPKERFTIPEETIGEQKQFLKENMEVDGLVFDNDVIGITLPIKLELEVTEAPPNIKGNTASGGDKVVTLETGATITTPMFIETGDIIEINTETGTYVRRV